jgi:antitoxin FitA
LQSVISSGPIRLVNSSGYSYDAIIEGDLLKAELGQLTVRNVDEQVVRALKKRAVEHGRSAEAEHRDILRQTLLETDQSRDSFARRAAEMRARLRSSVDSTELIRRDRDTRVIQSR